MGASASSVVIIIIEVIIATGGAVYIESYIDSLPAQTRSSLEIFLQEAVLVSPFS